jgi:O-antigen/teichoic acid export membrane protein
MITALPTAMTVFGSGVSGCILRKTPFFQVNSNSKDFTSMFATGFVLNLISAIAIILMGYIFSDTILEFILSEKNVSKYESYFILAFWNVFFKYLSVVATSALDGLQKFKERSIINASSSLIVILITIPFITHFGLFGVLLIQIIQSIFILIFSFIYVFRSEFLKTKYFRPSIAYLKLFLIEGKNFQLISVSILFFEPVSKYFIKKYTNYDIVSLYDICMRATTQLHSVLNAGIQVIIPRITELDSKNELNLKLYFLKALRVDILVSSVLFTFLSFLLVNGSLLFNESSHKIFSFFIIGLSLAYMICAISIVPYSILLGIGNTKAVLISHLISTVLNAIFYMFLFQKKMSFLIIAPPIVAIVSSSLFLLIYCMIKFKVHAHEFIDEFKLASIFMFFNIILFIIQQFPFMVIIQLLEILFFFWLIFKVIKNKFLNEIVFELVKKSN